MERVKRSWYGQFLDCKVPPFANLDEHKILEYLTWQIKCHLDLFQGLIFGRKIASHQAKLVRENVAQMIAKNATKQLATKQFATKQLATKQLATKQLATKQLATKQLSNLQQSKLQLSNLKLSNLQLSNLQLYK